MSENAPIDFGSIEKNADSVRLVELEFFDIIAEFWRAGDEQEANKFIRPRISTGFSYEATTAGQSGEREPRWPKTLGLTVPDGSVIWTARAAGANGVGGLSVPAAAVSPSGQLTATSVSAVDGKATSSRIRLTLTAGRAGSTYEITGTVTSGTQTLAFTFTVEVK